MVVVVLTEVAMQHLGAEAAQQQQRHDYYKILGILPTARVSSPFPTSGRRPMPISARLASIPRTWIMIPVLDEPWAAPIPPNVPALGSRGCED